jgi:hypothetical protein
MGDLILILIKISPFLANVFANVVMIAFCMRRNFRAPLWSIICLFGLSAFTFLILHIFSIESLGRVVATVIVASISLAHALVLFACRFIKTSMIVSWGLATIVLLPTWLWLDSRFRIIVVDTNGEPVEAHPAAIHFHRPPLWGESFDYGHGTRLDVGIIHFGFCQWLQHGKRWMIFGGIRDSIPEGRGRGHGIPLTYPGWNQWPIRVVVPAETP